MTNDSDTEISELDQLVADAARANGSFGAALSSTRPGLARELLVTLAAGYAHELINANKTAEGAVWMDFSVRLSGVLVSEEMTPMADAERLTYAKELLRVGCFRLAEEAYRFLMENGAGNYDLATTLSGLQNKIGESDRARETLITYFKANPSYQTRAKKQPETAPTILKIRGFDKTDYKIAPDERGGWEQYSSGGHFMLKHLLDMDAYTFENYTVCEGNILSGAPLPPYDLILNTAADADREGKSLQALAEFLTTAPSVPVINHPSKVLATTRDENHRRLNGLDGIIFPRTERLPASEGATPFGTAARIKELGFEPPFIIRRTGTHTAVSTALIETDDQLKHYLTENQGEEFYLIEFIENASPEGHYSKLRFLAVDGQLYPVVYHTDEVWNVHGGNRKTFMAAHDWMIEREKRFTRDPRAELGGEIYDRLARLPELVGLDFFGFDFTLLPSGDVLVFELNPAMRHSFTHAETFDYLRPSLQRISDAFAAMIESRLQP